MSIRNVLFVQPFSFLEEQLSHLLLIWPIYLENFVKYKIKNLTSDVLYLPVEQKRGKINTRYVKDIKDFDKQSFNNQMQSLISDLKFEISSDTIICISASFSQLYFPTKIVAEYFQETFPASIIVIGGIHVSAFPQSFLKNSFADFLVLGEGEQMLAEIIKQNPKKHKNPIIVKGEPVINLDDLPPIDFTLFDKYVELFKDLSISLSRGCPYDCYFCSERCLSDNNGRIIRWRSYSPKRAVEETRTMINYGLSYNISEFGFVDPVFGLKSSWLNKFLDLYSFESEYIKWCETRLNLMSESIIKKFENQKFLVMYGVESFNADQLVRLNKTNSPKVYLEKFNKLLNIHRDLKNIFALNILVGAPGENNLSINDTFNRLEEMISKQNVNNVYFNIRYYHHFPFTELYNNIFYFNEHYGTHAYQPSIDWWSSTSLEMQKYGPYCIKPSFEFSLRNAYQMYTDRFIDFIRIEIDKIKESKPTDALAKGLMLKKEIPNLIKKRDEFFNFLDKNNIELNEK